MFNLTFQPGLLCFNLKMVFKITINRKSTSNFSFQRTKICYYNIIIIIVSILKSFFQRFIIRYRSETTTKTISHKNRENKLQNSEVLCKHRWNYIFRVSVISPILSSVSFIELQKFFLTFGFGNNDFFQSHKSLHTQVWSTHYSNFRWIPSLVDNLFKDKR